MVFWQCHFSWIQWEKTAICSSLGTSVCFPVYILSLKYNPPLYYTKPFYTEDGGKRFFEILEMTLWSRSLYIMWSAVISQSFIKQHFFLPKLQMTKQNSLEGCWMYQDAWYLARNAYAFLTSAVCFRYAAGK